MAAESDFYTGRYWPIVLLGISSVVAAQTSPAPDAIWLNCSGSISRTEVGMPSEPGIEGTRKSYVFSLSEKTFGEYDEKKRVYQPLDAPLNATGEKVTFESKAWNGQELIGMRKITIDRRSLEFEDMLFTKFDRAIRFESRGTCLIVPAQPLEKAKF